MRARVLYAQAAIVLLLIVGLFATVVGALNPCELTECSTTRLHGEWPDSLR